MILENTPYSVVFKTMLEEKEKVDFFVNKEVKRSQDISSREGPLWIAHSTYTVPKSRNTYLFWCGMIVTPTRFQRIGNNNYRAGSCLMVDSSNGQRTIIVMGKKNTGARVADSLMVYTGHFLSRYRERCKWPDTMSTLDLITTFLTRNTECVPLEFRKVVKKWEQYPDGVALQMADGVILGTETWHDDLLVFKSNTFLPESLLKGDQQEALWTDEKYRQIIAEYMKENPLIP